LLTVRAAAEETAKVAEEDEEDEHATAAEADAVG
jgi:hypothetical protein